METSVSHMKSTSAELPSAVAGAEEIAAASREDGSGDDADGLENFSTVAMASKAQLLQSLSVYLSCVATTMSFSTKFNAFSARIGASSVFLGHKEVAQLHELVVRELKGQTYFLSTLSWICSRQIEERPDCNFTRVLNLKIVSQTLRCCIRILPLVDCFDKNASLTSTKLLDGILQQLCDPTKLFHLLRLKASEGMQSKRSHQTAQGDEDGTYLENAESHEAWMANVLDTDSQYRKELIFAIIEVYLDELLLHPDLIARLLRSRENTSRSFAQEQITCRVKHTEASLEAAFVHILSSHYSAAGHQASPRSRKGFLGGNLSLPAGLILLEKFSKEEIPPPYIAHVVRLLARILNDTTPVSHGQVDDLSRTRRILVKNCWAGGVDWSYCSQELLPNFDFKEDHCPTGGSRTETTLSFASSILEQAIQLYSRISLASDTCADGSRPVRCQTLEKSLLEFYLSKYTPLFDISIDGPELDTTDGVSGSGDIGIGLVNLYRDYCHCCSTPTLDAESIFPLENGTGIFGFAGQFVHQGLAAGLHCAERINNVVFDGDDVKDTSGLVVALLQLMSCTLKCICREVYTSTWLKFLDPRAGSLSEPNETDFDKILQCVGLSLSLCFPAATDHERPCGRAGQHGDSNPLVSPRGSLNNLVGQAIVFFTRSLRGEVWRGAPDEILEEYFHLVESLVALLLALDERNDNRKSNPECNLVCNCTPCDDICRIPLEVSRYGKCRSSPFENDVQQRPMSISTSSYLEEMVLSLRGVLQDLSEQQRPMPEFFLFFILKQFSAHDALSLVAMAFSSCLHNQSGDLQTVTGSTELFQTERLVTEVLHLALSEPTKPCSLITFIIYMVDILQDHSSITVALSTSEISEPFSWFETIAYILTLAAQLVVCERRMLIRKGKEFFISFILKTSEGIDRILTEGIAAAHWLSHHCKTVFEETGHKFPGAWEATGTGTDTGRYFGEEAWNVIGSLGQCNTFLEQVDLLRNAVEELASTADPSPDCELTSLLEKGRVFFAALSEVPTEQIGNLVESRWSLYISEQTQQRSVDIERGSRLPANSVAVGLGCAHTDSHKKEVSEIVVGETQECQVSRMIDATLVGDQTLQTEKVSCSEGPSPLIGSNLARQEEVIIAQSNSYPEFFVPSTVVTVEKRQTRSATLLITQNLNTQDDGLVSQKPQPLPQERKRCSALTSAIIKRLLRKTFPSRGKSTSSYQICNKRPAKVSKFILNVEQTPGQQWGSCAFMDDATDGDVPPSTSSNLFVNSLNKQDPSDSFEDLKDFIVTKPGRDYPAWLKRRQKVRHRLYSKNVFKRLQEKKELLHLLDM